MSQKKTGNKGLQSTDSVVTEFSRLRPIVKYSYNFRFNEPNFRLVDLKMTNLKLLKFLTGVSKFVNN